MNIKKWLQGELFAVLKRQPLPYRDPVKIRNMIRDIPAPHFILFASVFTVPVKFQQLILEPCEWVLKRRSFFLFLVGCMKINVKIRSGSAQGFPATWIQLLPGAHLHFPAKAFTFCGNPHSLLLAALQTPS